MVPQRSWLKTMTLGLAGAGLLLGSYCASARSSQIYMGRPIAGVMGAGGSDWLEREDREAEERVSRLVDALPLKGSMTVADIGAGSGYVSRQIARKIQPHGQVLAVDIQKEMLSRLSNEAKKAGIRNIKTILGAVDDPRLAPGSVDLAILVDVYHEFSQPYEMIRNLSLALKPGGLIALVEYRGEDPTLPIKAEHKMTLDQIKKEFGLKEFQLTLLKVDRRLPRQHLVFFRKGE